MKHTPSARLADTLAATNRRRFVGRVTELRLVERLLQDSAATSLVWLWGPGGVGKSSLVDRWAEMSAASGRAVVRIDGRIVAPNPRDIGACLGSVGGDVAVLIDTYEALEAVDGWLRTELLPSLPAGAVVVVAGRNPPKVEWRADPGWSTAMAVVQLRNLRREESHRYLTAAGVPEVDQGDIVEFTHGNPLALALLVDLYRVQPGNFTVDHPAVHRELLSRLIDDVPSEDHRRALQVCAHLRTTTEDDLVEALGKPAARVMWDWLGGLSFVEADAHGVYPHELIRDLIEADLRWRSPERYRALHLAVRRRIVRRLRDGTVADRQDAFADLLFLHRRHPVMRPLFQWNSLDRARPTHPSPAETDLLVTAVRDQHGPASAAVLAYWAGRQPGSLYAFRTEDRSPVGFTCLLDLSAVTAHDLAADPAVAAASAFMVRAAPVRPGEKVLYGRFILSLTSRVPTDTPGVWEVTSSLNATRWVSTPRLAWAFNAMPDGDRWEPFFRHIRQTRLPAAGFDIDGRRFAVFGHDWRSEPPMAWLDAMAERELATGLEEDADLELQQSIATLSEDEFASAVRQALRDLTRADRLASNPLVSSRLITRRLHGRSAVTTLQEVLRQRIDSLDQHPRDRRFFRALHRTFANPADTQEQAADVLGLPFSTYRSHLRDGERRVTAMLWHEELYGADRP